MRADGKFLHILKSFNCVPAERLPYLREKILEVRNMARVEYTIKTTLDDGAIVEKPMILNCLNICPNLPGSRWRSLKGLQAMV